MEKPHHWDYAASSSRAPWPFLSFEGTPSPKFGNLTCGFPIKKAPYLYIFFSVILYGIYIVYIYNSMYNCITVYVLVCIYVCYIGRERNWFHVYKYILLCMVYLCTCVFLRCRWEYITYARITRAWVCIHMWAYNEPKLCFSPYIPRCGCIYLSPSIDNIGFPNKGPQTMNISNTFHQGFVWCWILVWKSQKIE